MIRSIKFATNLFEDGNVLICGLRGRGKDMLMANVACRSKQFYVSNIDYGGKYLPLEFDKLNVGLNTYRDFVNGTVKKYECPYPDGTNIYISDCGIYLPSQYCNELNKYYPYLPTFFSLSRQLIQGNMIVNSQAINRTWDKIREQADTYIYCEWCKVIGNIVIQKVTTYDRYESAEKHVLPFRVRAPLFSMPQTKIMVELQHDQYIQTHGHVNTEYLIYLNKSTYDTRYFKGVLKNGS